MFYILLVFLLLFARSIDAQDDEGPYRGKYIGKLNSYHHQVSGDVYAVDDYTILLTAFNYDGNGADTFFWSGAANRPGPQGFIVPDEYGKTNVLERYFNKDFTLTLPDKKKLADVKWFAIYDLWSQNTFGDIYIPEEFEPPTIQKISQLSSKTSTGAVSSGNVEIVDSKTIRLPDFRYDGSGKEVYFWVGVGPQPASKGIKVPDEYGYFDPIRSYKGDVITVELAGETTIFNIDWFSVFDKATNENLGSVIIPDGLNVPPSLVKVIPLKNNLPNCLQLHKDLRVSWEIFGPAITIQLAGQVREDEYMSFGISGSETESRMSGADIAVGYVKGVQGYATDYKVTALSPCVKVLGQYKGACRDTVVGGQDDNQLHNAIREDGVNFITYRRSLISSDNGDKNFPTDKDTYIVWAIGRLDSDNEPTFHDIYPKANVRVNLNVAEPTSNCVAFTQSTRPKVPAAVVITPGEKNGVVPDMWEKRQIYDRTIRTFNAYVGPSAGKKGYQGTTGFPSTTLAWYINGLLVPEIWLRRGLTYAFKVFGGNNPHSAEFYHPLIITDEPRGGFDTLSDEAQSRIRVLAGLEYSRRGRPRPTAAGPLCLSQHRPDADRRLDDDFPTFKKFNRSLQYSCETGAGAVLELTPNTSWPDIVYYQSFTQAHMGWKIHIVDNYGRSSGSSMRERWSLHALALILNVWLYLN